MSERTEKLRQLLAGACGRITVTGHDGADVDSVVSCVLVQRLLQRWQISCRIALNAPDRQSRRVLAHFGIDAALLEGETKPEDCLILVDHHQSAHPGRVIACIDHHPTDYPPEYPYVQLEDSGACAVMVLRLMQEAGVGVAPEDEQLAITALYLDTIALRSAKITREEAAWGRREAGRLGLDEGWLEKEGMGLTDMSLPAGTLAMLGKKRFQYGNQTVLSTYVQTDAMTQEKLDAILDALREAMAHERADLWVFLVHDPRRGRSMQVNLAPDGGTEQIHYDYLVSRGKDVMPRVERMIRALADRKDGNERGGISSGTDACAGSAACRQGKHTAGA